MIKVKILKNMRIFNDYDTDLSIVTGEKNFTMEIEYFRRNVATTGGRLESFIIQFKGSIAGRMPQEHMVTIDAAGNAHLGYCASAMANKNPNDMRDIFQSVYR